MSPEAVNGKISRASDIWAVGVMTLQLATGHNPWSSLGHLQPLQLLYHIAQGNSPAVPDHLPPALKSFLWQCFLLPHNTRPTAAQLLATPWMMMQSAEAQTPPPTA
eukprot:TRINITY_DN55225_c0_g1_i2.p2 TRINITY_DN55225_c0_g1~~TRINITY_DN55225_c0_g1_i2.p2  ORF type:complete len:106 (+),score=10.31 TRINITY_DN55225_c0_g1_i2:306-623(+)